LSIIAVGPNIPCLLLTDYQVRCSKVFEAFGNFNDNYLLLVYFYVHVQWKIDTKLSYRTETARQLRMST